MNLISHVCPHHGQVLDTVENAIVTCHCGATCAPPHSTPQDHVRAYRKRASQRHLMRRRRAAGSTPVKANIGPVNPLSQAKSESDKPAQNLPVDGSPPPRRLTG